MIDYILQLISIIILILIIVTNRIDQHVSYLNKPNIQIILAIITMLIFVFIDPFAGFILVIALFVLYYKTMYVSSHKPDTKNTSSYQDTLKRANLDTVYGSYITPEHLDSAQNNIVGDLQQPILGFNPDTINPTMMVSNAQGLDKDMPAYDNVLYQEIE